jgi:hypothetical protein
MLVRQVQEDVGAQSAHLGWRVALEGDVFAAGAPFAVDGGSFRGAVYVYGRNEGGADQWGLAKKLVAASGIQDNDQFGLGVAVDGDLLLVGIPGRDSSRGRVQLFGRNQGGADQWGLVKDWAANDLGSGDNFGYSLAIEGGLALVNKRSQEGSAGAAFVYGRNSGGTDNWGLMEQVTPSQVVAGDLFGLSAAMDSTLAVGAPYHESKRGAVHVLSGFDLPALAVRGTNGTVIASGEAASAAKGTDFGALVSGTAKTNALVLTNAANATLHLGSATIQGDGAGHFSVLDVPGSVAGRGKATFRVVYAPSAAGAHEAQVELANDSATSPYVVRLSGSSQVPGLALLGTNGASIASGEAAGAAKGGDFGGAAVGASVTNRFVVTNAGTVPLTVGAVSTNGSGFFRVVSKPTTVAAGGSAFLSVAFQPASDGSATASLHVANNSATADFVLNVAGTGAYPSMALRGTNGAAMASGAAASAALGSDFGAVAVGQSASRTFAVTNASAVPLTLGSVSTNGSGRFRVTAKPATVAGGGTGAVTIAFTPTAMGAATASLSFANSSTTTPYVVNVAGEGLMPVIGVLGTNGAALSNGQAAGVAAGTEFARLEMGRATTNVLAITNSGAVALSILGVRTNGTGAASFRVAGLPTTVGAGQKTNFSLVFAPTTYGRRTAALVLSNNSAEAAFTVNLAGDGMTTLARNGPLAGGNVLTIEQGSALGNGSDIGRVTVGGVAATILAQGTHYVVFRVPAGAAAGAVDVVIESASAGTATLDDAYLYNPVGSIYGAPGVAAGWTNVGVSPWWRIDWGMAHDGTVPYVAARDDSDTETRQVYRWDGADWTSLGRTFTNQIDCLLHDGSNLYVGVDGGVDVWDGSTWTSRGGLSGRVISLARNGSKLYAGLEVSSGASNVVHEWNGSAWIAIGAAGTDREWEVESLLHDGSHLYAAGFFYSLNGVALEGVGRWDGSVWEPLVAGPVYHPVEGEGGVEAPGGYFDGGILDMEKVGGNFYVGGSFRTFGNLQLNGIAKWIGNDWTNVGTGFDELVYALATDGTNLYAGGYFINAGALLVNQVAKWTGTAWTNLGLGVNGPVQNILWTNGELYVMGGFYEAGGIPAAQVAKWTDGRAAGTGVAPESGSKQGGYRVTISGTNLGFDADVTNVVLCGVGVREIVSQSATQVVVVAGTSANTGTGHVRVYSTSHGMAVRSNAFTYLDVPAFKLTAVALTNSVMLRWPNPQDYGYGSEVVNLRYSATDYPAATNAGTGIYLGANRSYEHVGRTSGQACYYSIFVSEDGTSFVEP